MNSAALFSSLVLVALGAILIHSWQYLAQSGLLFTTVVIARFLVAALAGAFGYIVMLVYRATVLPSIRQGTMLNICAFLSAAVAILMVVAGRGVALSETLSEIYLMQG